METYLEDLRESNDFLNLLLDNINSAVLIADENLKIHQINDFFRRLFNMHDIHVDERSFGSIVGCIHAVRENQKCGETSHCENCLIRQSILRTLLEKVPADKVRIEREFILNGSPQKKYLEFSTRHLTYKGRRMILGIIYDVTELELQKLALQQKQSLLDRDLKAAAGIQQSLLPSRSPAIPGMKVAWRFEPSWQIGGDIFNIHYQDEGRMGFYMLDVCGHGVSAAMIAVAVSQFLANSRQEKNPVRQQPEYVLDQLEAQFPFERFESYFSILYGLFDHHSGELAYGCAGHPSPVLLRAGRPCEILGGHGPVIGLNTGRAFRQQAVLLQPGDRILVYTDGALDIRNTAGELLGRNRFLGLLQHTLELPLGEMVDTVYNGLKAFGRKWPPEDDISLLALEYTPGKPALPDSR